jgi:hypothetical protein
MEHACPYWSSAACSHVIKLQAVQIQVFSRSEGALQYISNKQIHEDLEVNFSLATLENFIQIADTRLHPKIVGQRLFSGD